LSKILYSLFYLPQKYAECEKEVFEKTYSPSQFYDFYLQLIQNKDYEKVLHLISKEVIRKCLTMLNNYGIADYVPFDEIEETYDRVEKATGMNGLKHDLGFDTNLLFWGGKIEELAEKQPDFADFRAIKLLREGNIDSALAAFNVIAKSQNSALPGKSFIAYFHILTLLQTEPNIATPVFQKIVKDAAKKQYPGFYYYFVAVALDALNEQKTSLKDIQKCLKQYLVSDKYNSTSMLYILLLYLSGERLAGMFGDYCYKTVEKAVQAGYLLLAYEAAFVLKSWFKEARFAELYENLYAELKYEPCISKIHRTEEWEKTLNTLLGFKSKKTTAKNGSKDEKKERVVYYLSHSGTSLQPVLQTRQAKGWSKGRNIAMKNFVSGINAMTEQDYRIAKSIKVSNHYYYGTDYDFPPKSFLELIGHPYVYLDGTDDIPVEFVNAQPIITVNKTDNGYRLESDVKKANTTIFVEKETNTRYKVYNLNDKQLHILSVINEGKIVVPENGKAKLTEVLGTLSGEGFNVHSDLVASAENTNFEVINVPTDSRIRVQLLAYGDGLKAELYAKPFGDRPPYCKAGKGGKVLISNEKDTQLQVLRDLEKEKTNEQTLLDAIQSLETLNNNDGLLSFDDPLDSLYLLDILKDKAEICVVEWAEGERYKLRGFAAINQLKINVKSGINWFDLDGELKIDENTVVSLQQLMKLTEKSHNRFVEISQGEFIALSERLKKQLDTLRAFSAGDKKTVRLNKFASAGLDDFFDEINNIKADKQWKEFRKNIETAKNIAPEIPTTLNAELRAYQEDGFRWLVRLAEWNAGACLADDMGLGKTVQTLALLLYRAKLGAALVVCPVSVVGNWIAEAEKFAPTLNFKTLGTSTSNRREVIDNLTTNDVLVTSYGLLQSEEKMFAEKHFATAVLDEAHVIKNYATKTSKATMNLQADFRIALTGTPLQNHLAEVWNLFNFINPGLLGSLQHFNDNFIKPEGEISKKQLKKLISPFILRRTKNAVLEELPPKTEIVKKITLSEAEMTFYEALRRQALENLATTDAPQHLEILKEIMKLRQASCNPLLVDKNTKITSSKLATFLDIIDELRQNNHRALVFSQFVTHLSIIRQAIEKQGITYQYIDGSTTQKERETAVGKFQSGEGELFLISLKAGGLGLNLTAADYVIHLDPWWNPAVEDQASDRAHRIGQQRPVTIYRLVAENTIEEKILKLHAHKRDLAEQLLEGSDMAAKLSAQEMLELIRENM